METIIQNYALHLDKLRLAYKITEVDFCEGICTPRNYRRYLSGERTIPHTKIMSFCKKLQISPNDFFYSYLSRDSEEFAQVIEIYLLLINEEYNKIHFAISQINRNRMLNYRNLKFLDLCIIKANYRAKREHPNETLSQVAALIDYPKMLKRKAFDIVDVIALNLIAKIEVMQKKTQALNRLREILHDQTLRYISFDSRSLLPSVYASVSILLGRLNQFEDSLKVADSGIEYSINHADISQLAKLRYMRSYDLLVLGYREEAEIEAIKCISLAISKDNLSEANKLYNVLLKDFKYDPLDLISKYKEKLINKATDYH